MFDKNGEIIAISNSEYSDIIGTSLNNAYIHNILYNTLAEKYFVSPFEATTLYKNRYTYIYGASITDINNEKHTVGGIGIVFDSEYQFKTMLKDALNSNANSFAVFTDRKGSVISSTVNELSPGKKLDLSNSKLFQVGNGKTKSEILVYNECYYAVGCACSSSYREYKKSDGYQNDVLAFVFQKLADCGSSSIYTADNQSVEQSDIMLKEGETQKLVVFEINHQPFALDQSLVLEAIDTSGIIALPGVGEIIKGAVQFNDKYIAVVDMHATFHYNEEGSPGSHLLIIELSDSVHIALEVDNLSSVIEINKSDIRPVPEICCSSSFISGIICIPGKDNSTMLLLDAKALLSKLEENQNGYEWNDILQIIGDLSAEKDEN
ncbi:MAG: chemotaxis protein CheW [Bacillota bacterium]|nr:chemotaxis protein CheW [Bacillota bacterium]